MYRWIKEYGESLPEPEISGEIAQMEFDEMRHFISSKKENFGLSKLLTIAMGELSPGFSVVVIAGRSSDYTTK